MGSGTQLLSSAISQVPQARLPLSAVQIDSVMRQDALEGKAAECTPLHTFTSTYCMAGLGNKPWKKLPKCLGKWVSVPMLSKYFQVNM